MAIAAVEGIGDHKVIVLHGWALDSGVWLAARVQSDVSKFTFAYVDFPGYGVAKDEAPAESVDAMAQAALDAAKELGWDRYSVLGHSMGGLTAFRVATLAPDHVTSVVAVTPASPAGTPLDEESFAGFAAAWADPGAAIKGALAPNIDDTDLARVVARNRASMSQNTWETYLATWSRCSFLDELKSLTMPVTILWGETDPFITQEYLAETVGTLQNVTTDMLANAGHYPMVEAPGTSVPAWEGAL